VIFAGLALLAVLQTAEAQTRGEYAVVLAGPPLARQAQSRKEILSSSPAAIRRSQTALRRLLDTRGIRVRGTAQTLVNAIFVDASAAEAEMLRTLPGVRRVEYLPPLKRQMDRASGLIRAPAAWDAAGGETNAGAGMKIGIIDTGIDQNHPGFRDDSLAIPDGYPKGSEADLPYTNHKIIVARSYVGLLSAPDDLSPRDHSGHGTASAMIAAGVRNTGPAGTIAGVAPKAFLGNYKVFGSQGVNDTTSTQVLVKALEDALADGMDVVALPLGAPPSYSASARDCGENKQTACDLRVEAVENAARLGLVTVVPAGNHGFVGLNYPTLNTINSPGTAPSAITVGASTNSHLFFASVTAAGQRYIALFGEGPKPAPTLAAPVRDVSQLGDDGLACKPLRAGSLSGAIALVARGQCDFFDKVGNSQRAGAAGVIIYQYEGEEGVFTPAQLAGTGIPAVLIGSAGGLAIRSLARAQPDSTVILDATLAPAGTTPDMIADFSSHGPAIGDVSKFEAPIKPDLVAVGQDVYTATQSLDPRGDLYDPAGYTAAQGASFAVPMVAGAVALVKQLNPNLSAAQLKSAVVNTAADEVNDEAGRARVIAAGAGKLNVAAAVRAPAAVEPATLSIGLIGPGTLPVGLALKITNLTTSPATFDLAVTPLDTDGRAQLTVSPSSVQLEPGQTTTATVRLAGSQPSPGSYSGAITIQGGGATLRVPYLYLVSSGAGADLVPISGIDGVSGVPGESGLLLSFKLIDRFGVPVPNAPVLFRVVSGGGRIALGDASTDVFGIAAALVDLGPLVGEQQFSAQAAGLTLDFFARVQPPAAGSNRARFPFVNKENDRSPAAPEPPDKGRVIPGMVGDPRRVRVR
jgi:hypothetical protein